MQRTTDFCYQVIARFLSPLGIYQLLQYVYDSFYLVSLILKSGVHSYMETGGAGATIRPWVWISWLSLGPLIEAGAMNAYMYLAVRAKETHTYHHCMLTNTVVVPGKSLDSG